MQLLLKHIFKEYLPEFIYKNIVNTQHCSLAVISST